MEYLDIVDEEGIPTGRIVSRDEAHGAGIRHRTAHVWIARLRGGRWEALLQKRSMMKESFPGLYDTSSAGHIPAGEEPLPSALRELGEELGIYAKPDELTFIGKFRTRYERVFHGKPFRDNEVTWVYLYTGAVDADKLTLQASEVDEARWFDVELVGEEIKTDRSRVCVPSGGFGLLMNYLSGGRP